MKIKPANMNSIFYEICTRYLSLDYIFLVDVNYPSGRADLEAISRS